MTAYLGRPGSFDALTVSSPMPIEVAGQVRSVTTLGGRRVAQLPVARSRRVWTVSRNAALPREWAVWQEYADGLWGVGPHTFVDPWTQVTNVLTREQSLFEGGWDLGEFTQQTGRLWLPNGRAVTAWASTEYLDENAVETLPVPVVPGVPVTVSVWGSQLAASYGGSVEVGVWLHDASGGFISLTSAYPDLSVSGLQQFVISVTPPTNAATLTVDAGNLTLLAAPQVTFTSGPVEHWTVGQVAQVVVSGGSHAPIIATHDVALTAGSVTVTEVG